VKLGYTEFSFGYAFTENLIRSSARSPTGAPQFPNLIQEAQLGYDVRIDLPACPLFFQFKLPELMVRNTALEISQHGLPLSCNFFRMPLMRRDISDQHQVLIQLEAANAGLVHYASPMLDDIQAFNSAYNLAAVHRHTAFFSPQDIGLLPDDKRHMVSYNAGASSAWFCSEPQKIVLRQFEHLVEKAAAKFEQPEFNRLEQVAFRTRGALRELGGEVIDIDENELRQRFRARLDADARAAPPTEREQAVAEELLAAREIARIGFGLEMIVVQPPLSDLIEKNKDASNP
jgi:hypothetical protein